MELRERKIINNTGNLLKYEGGKLLHGASLLAIDGMITGGVNFLGQAANSFGDVKSSGDILTESGTSVGQGSGFTYLKLNSVDAGALMSELSQLNTANTLLTAAAGASLGSAFGPIGAGIGGVVGGAVGFVGGLFRKNKMAERIKQAQLLATRNNNFALASALTDFLTNDYNVKHDNTLDDLLYQAKDGKEPGGLKHFEHGLLPNAMVSNGEIIGHVDAFGNVMDAVRVGHGKDNKDNIPVHLAGGKLPSDNSFVITNKYGISDYVAATGDIAGGLEMLKYMKDFRAVKLLSTGAFNYKNGLMPKFEDGNNPYGDWYDPNRSWDVNWMRNRKGIAYNNAKEFINKWMPREKYKDPNTSYDNYVQQFTPEVVNYMEYPTDKNNPQSTFRLPQYYKIDEINKKHDFKPYWNDYGDPEQRNKEVYEDLQKFRKENKLDPRTIYYKSDVNQWNKEGKFKGSWLNTLPQDVLLDYFNEVASAGNKIDKNGKLLAKYGKLPKITPFGNFQYEGTSNDANLERMDRALALQDIKSALNTDITPGVGKAITTNLSDVININRNPYSKWKRNNSEDIDGNDNSNIYNVITSSAGILGGLSQILGAHNQPLNKPDTYASNQYEKQALDIYGWLNPATNRAVSAAAATEARNKYNINRMGGLSGALKYLAAVLSGVGLLKNIADIIAETQMQRNQLKSQLAGAMLNTGAANAQRRLNANQYLDEAYARSHGARTQMEQMGVQNMIAALNQYYKNFDKLNRFNRTMAYYDQDYQLRKDALKKGFYV